MIDMFIWCSPFPPPVSMLLPLVSHTTPFFIQTLRNRHLSGDMYTSIGPVLIAVNPYQLLSKGGQSIYAAGVADYYHRKVEPPLPLYTGTVLSDPD